MKRRFLQFALADRRARKKADTISLLVAVAWGIFAFLTGSPGEDAAKSSVSVLTAAMVITTVYYCLSAEDSVTLERKAPRLRRSTFLAQLSGFAGLAISSPAIQASLVDRRIRAALSRPISDDSLDEIRKITKQVQEQNLPASSALLSKAGKSLASFKSSDSSLQQKAWTTRTDLASLRSSLSPDRRNVENSAANGKRLQTKGFWTNMRNFGGPFPERVILPGTHWVDDPSQAAAFERLSERYETTVGGGPSQLALVGNSVGIDGIFARNITLIGVTILYNGDAVRLENVTFVNCFFSLVTENPPCKRFLDGLFEKTSHTYFSQA